MNKKTLFISCKIGPHPVHKSFAKSINSDFTKCTKIFTKYNNTPLLILESFLRSHKYTKYTKIIIEGMESIYLGYFIKLLNPKIKLIYQDTDPFFLRDYPKYTGTKKLIIDKILNKIDIFICDSKNNEKAIHKYFPNKKTHTISPFINTTNFNFKPNLKTKNIIYVGRLHPEKNLINLIKTFKKIIHKYPTTKLYLVGEGPQKTELKKLIKKEKIKNIIFLGHKNNFNKYLEKSLIGYNISQYESFGITGLEFAMSGLIPIIGKNNGNQDALTNKNLIVDPNSLDTIYQTILKIYNLENNEKLKIITNLRDNSKKYSKPTQINKFKKLINTI